MRCGDCLGQGGNVGELLAWCSCKPFEVTCLGLEELVLAGILLNLASGLPLPVQFLMLLLEPLVILFECLGLAEIGKSVLDLQLELVLPICQLIQFVFGESVDQLQQPLSLPNASVIGFRLGQPVELLLAVKAKRQAIEKGFRIGQVATLHGWAAVLPNDTIFDAIRADPAHFDFCAGFVQRIAYSFDPLFGPVIKILRFVLSKDDSQVFKQSGFPAASAPNDTVHVGGKMHLLIGQERHVLDRDRLDGRLTNTLCGVRICCYIFRQNDAGFMVEERLAERFDGGLGHFEP